MRSLEEDGRFAAALEECCRRVQRGERLERCLADYPREYREELARLAPLAGRVGLLRRDPSPEFQARLERRLLASVDQARPGKWPERLWFLFPVAPALRAAVATLVVLVLLSLSGAGAVRVSAGSLPDSPLYQVKAAREWVQLTMARDGESRVGVHSEQIGERGRELERSIQAGKPRRVLATLAAKLAISTERMVDQALELQARGRPQAVARALAVIQAMERQLDRLEARVSGEARPILQRLRGFLDMQERRLLKSAPQGFTPRALLYAMT